MSAALKNTYLLKCLLFFKKKETDDSYLYTTYIIKADDLLRIIYNF